MTGMSDPLNDDDFMALPEMTPEWMAEIIGEPPGWYYPLVGRVATVMGGVEQDMVELAFEFVQPQYSYWDVLQQLDGTNTMRDLFRRVDDARFAALLNRFWEARKRRDGLVHVFVAWHDYEGPDEPAGWHFVNPRLTFDEYLQRQLRQRRTGRKRTRKSGAIRKAPRGTGYLDMHETQARMEEDLQYILDLRDDVNDLYNEMQQ